MKLKNIPKRTKQEAKSAAIVASIDDLLTEILLRLPIKSLLQFKIVSKQWHSLITNPQFCYRRNPSPNPAVGVFLRPIKYRIGLLFEYVSFFPNTKSTINRFKQALGFNTLQSCNGLLLCWNSSSYMNYHVYNPTTNQLSPLPKLDQVLKEIHGNGIRGMYLAFDPSKSPHYQVVSVCYLSSLAVGYLRYQIVIYSSETGAWRISSEPPFTTRVGYGSGVYWNDAIHWIGTYEDGFSLYFNIHHQVLEKMPSPPVPSPLPNRRDFYFGESCDHLHYIQTTQRIKFNVYEMKRDYSEWFVKYKVDLSVVASANPEMIRPGNWVYCNFSMISIVRCEEQEEDASFLVFQIPGKAIRYNIVSKTFEKLHEFEGRDADTFRYSSVSGYQYIESMCCV